LRSVVFTAPVNFEPWELPTILSWPLMPTSSRASTIAPTPYGSSATRGWQIAECYHDAGISGAKGRKERPGVDQMLNDAGKGRFDVVMVWAIDRLGRSLVDLLTTIQHLEACKTDVFIEQQNLDTTTPMGKLLFQITGAFAEFERHMIKQRVAIGIRRAREEGTKSGKPFGRPKLDGKKEAAVRKALALGNKGILKIAAELGVGSGTVQRIKAAMVV
jgi:DNA invertase Pin-like site-specific DNA recombinase